ncbi:MAG: hypothetical protein WCH76_03300, partial [Candidatus Riflemargulisbacteria bacterium]
DYKVKSWRNTPGVDIASSNSVGYTGLSSNYLYRVSYQVRNNVALVATFDRWIILDDVAPTFNQFSLSEAITTDYGGSSAKQSYYGLQALTVNWRASDNIYVELSRNTSFFGFATKDHQGIYQATVFFTKDSLRTNIVTRNQSLTINNQFTITRSYVQNQIKEGMVTIGVELIDFAGNSSITYDVLWFDWSNTINAQIKEIVVTYDKTNNLAVTANNYNFDDRTPFNSSFMIGVYDQTTINLQIILTLDAYDTTALSTLLTQRPIVAYVSYNALVFTINSQYISVSYDFVNSDELSGLNISGLTLDVTLNVQGQISTTLYQGRFGLMFKFIDGAGILSTFDNKCLIVTVDLTAPTSSALTPWCLNLAGVSRNLIGIPNGFSGRSFSNTSNFIISLNSFMDSHSGLAINPYYIFVTGNSVSKNTEGNTVITGDFAGWQVSNTFNISKLLESKLNYDVVSLDIVMKVNNAAGIVTWNQQRIYVDKISPEITTFNRTKHVDVDGDGYLPEQENIYNKQAILLTWDMFDNLGGYAGNLGIVPTAGIWYVTLAWKTSTVNEVSSGEIITKGMLFSGKEWLLPSTYISNNIMQGFVTFTLTAYDYANNVTTSYMNLVFDWDNAPPTQSFGFVPDDTDNSIMPDGVLPDFGYFDQAATVSFYITFDSIADVTGISTKNIIIEYAKSNGQYLPIVSSNYNYSITYNSGAVAQDFVIITVDINFTNYLESYGGTVGGLAADISFQLLDRAGVKRDDRFVKRITIDMEAPTKNFDGEFLFTLDPGGDENQNGILPLTGFYKSPTISARVAYNGSVTSNGFADMDDRVFFRLFTLEGKQQLRWWENVINTANTKELVSEAEDNFSFSFLSDNIVVSNNNIGQVPSENSYIYEAYIKDKAGHIYSTYICVTYDNTAPSIDDGVLIVSSILIAPDNDSFGDGINPLVGYFDSLTMNVNISLITKDYWVSLLSNKQCSDNLSGFMDSPVFVKYSYFMPTESVKLIVASVPTIVGSYYSTFWNARDVSYGPRAFADYEDHYADIVLTNNSTGDVYIVIADKAGNATKLRLPTPANIQIQSVTVDMDAPTHPSFKFELVDTTDSKGSGILPDQGYFDELTISFNFDFINITDNGISDFRINKYLITTFAYGEARTSSNFKWFNVTSYNSGSLVDLNEAGDTGWVGQKFNEESMGIASPYFNGIKLKEGEQTVWLGIVDRAGNVQYASYSIIADITTPNISAFMIEFATASILLRDGITSRDITGDVDSGLDGIDPYYGYFDDISVDVMIVTISYSDANARRNAYFVRAVESSVTADYQYKFQSSSATYNSNGVVVTESAYGQSSFIFDDVRTNVIGNQPVILYVSDRAGNVVTREIFVTVDITPPIGNAELSLSNDIDLSGSGINPLYGFFKNVTVNFTISNNVTDDISGLRENQYLIAYYYKNINDNYPEITRNFFEHNYRGTMASVPENTLSQNYGQTVNIIREYVPSRSFEGTLVLYAAIANKAGGLFIVTKEITIDRTPPSANSYSDFRLDLVADKDSGYFGVLDGIDPVPGHYDSPTISIVFVTYNGLTDNSSGFRHNRFFVRVSNRDFNNNNFVSFNFSYASQNIAGDTYFEVDGDNPGASGKGSHVPGFDCILVSSDYSKSRLYTIIGAIADRAGNIITRDVKVTVDMILPGISAEGITVDLRVELVVGADADGNGIPPLYGWYDTTNVEFSISLDGSIISADDFSGVRQEGVFYFVTVNANAYNNTQNVTSVSVLNDSLRFIVSVDEIKSELLPNYIYVIIQDYAGNVKVIKSAVYVDITAPGGPFALTIEDDKTVNDNQVMPETGWYNDNTLDFYWKIPTDNISLRDKPYRIKINNGTWSDFMNQVVMNNYLINEALFTVNVQVQAVDKAGKDKTVTASVFVDTVKPGTFNVYLDYLTLAGIAPLDGWYKDTGVDIRWDAATDNSFLRGSPYQVKGMGSYGSYFAVTKAVDVLVEEGYKDFDTIKTEKVFVRAVDKAGNYRETYVNVNVDKTNPTNVTVKVLSDNMNVEPTYAPYLDDYIWYNQNNIRIAWTAGDLGGIRPTGCYFVRVEGQAAWTTIDVASNVMSMENFQLKSPTIDPTRVEFMAVDNAGNSKTAFSNLFIVDCTPPSVSLTLIPDYVDGKQLLDGWYSKQKVSWQWIASDVGGFPPQAYRYKEVSDNEQWSPWQSAMNCVITMNWGVPREFVLEARDLAGNSTRVTKEVNIAPFATDLISSNLFVSIDIFEAGQPIHDGVTPDLNWFNVNTINVKISHNFEEVLSNNRLTRDVRYFVRVRELNIVYVSSISTINNIYIPDTGVSGKTLEFGIRLANGM